MQNNTPYSPMLHSQNMCETSLLLQETMRQISHQEILCRPKHNHLLILHQMVIQKMLPNPQRIQMDREMLQYKNLPIVRPKSHQTSQQHCPSQEILHQQILKLPIMSHTNQSIYIIMNLIHLPLQRLI